MHLTNCLSYLTKFDLSNSKHTFYKLDRGTITDISQQLLLLVQKSFEDREQGPLGNIC